MGSTFPTEFSIGYLRQPLVGASLYKSVVNTYVYGIVNAFHKWENNFPKNGIDLAIPTGPTTACFDVVRMGNLPGVRLGFYSLLPI